MWKLFAALAILMLFGAAGLGYKNQETLKRDKDKLARVTQNRVDAETKLAKTEKSLKEKKAEVASHTGELADAEKVTAEKKSTFEDKEKEKNDLQAVATQLRTKVEAAREKVAKFGDIEETQRKLKELETAVADLTSQKEAWDEKVRIASAATDRAKKNLETKKAKEEQQSNGVIVDKVMAKISEANNEAGFVVIDAGFTRGIVAGGKLQVIRGSTEVAKLQVTTLEPGRAVANIMKGSLADGVQLRRGDRVVSESAAPEASTTATAGS